MIVKKKMHPKCITVWCALRSRGIIGPFFVENEANNALVVNGERYRNIMIQILVSIEDNTFEGMIFQQDGATCHTSSETLPRLHESFPRCVIICFGVRFMLKSLRPLKQ